MLRYLLLPIVILVAAGAYVLWYRLARRKLELEQEGRLPHWQEAPWTWIAVAGLAAGVVFLVFMASLGGDEPGRDYVPPTVVDGEIVPGHTE